MAHYVRISTEEQKKGHSTSEQRRKLDEHSEREDHEVVERIVEEGDSGANPFRSGVGRILELAEAGASCEVWSTKRDRLFRLQLEEDLRDLGVALRSLDDTGNRFVDAITDEYAEEERGRVRVAEAALERLEELAEEDWVREDTAGRVRGLYNYRRNRFVSRFDGDPTAWRSAPPPTSA